jgi:DNA modification methylase
MITLLRGEAVARLGQLESESIDSFVTDPPYGIQLQLKTLPGRPRSILGDGRLEAIELWKRWLPEAFRVSKPNTAHLIFGTWKSLWMRDLIEQHFRVADCIIWDKKCPSMLGYYFRPRWELIWYCVKGKVPRPSPVPVNLWQICRELKPKHPCQKPVSLLQQCIRLTCPPGGIVADPFSGIGSTAVAAIAEGRSFWGTEIDTRFHALAEKRIAEALRQQQTP